MASLTEVRVFDAFRRWGYLAADLDPLGYLKPLTHPELAIDGEVVAQARRCYCGTIGAEFMHIPDPERRQWIQERLEAAPAPADSARVLERLTRAGILRAGAAIALPRNQALLAGRHRGIDPGDG